MQDRMKHHSMSRAEIEAALTRLRVELKDLEETISFEYTFTAAHIGGRQVRNDEETLARLRHEIARLQDLLARTDESLQ